MVQLTRIYTRGGDKGKTSLGDGKRVAKHDLRVAAYGTADETNAVVGLARLHLGADAAGELAAIDAAPPGCATRNRAGKPVSSNSASAVYASSQYRYDALKKSLTHSSSTTHQA